MQITLILLSFAVISLLICAGPSTCSTRTGAFIGYTERSQSCKDDLGEDVCTAYKASMMCKTGRRGSQTLMA